MVEAAGFIVEGLLVADPNLQVVAAGHVGQREALRAPAGPGNRRRQVDRRAIPEVGAALEDRSVVTRDARLGEVDPVGDLPRRAGFEQQAAGHGRGPRALHHAGRPEVPAALRLDRVRAGERPRRAAAILLDVAEEAELVLFRRLPRRPQGMGPEPVEGGRGTRQVRLVGNRRGAGDPRFALELVEERARLVDARAPSADRGEEPHLVLHDRAAQLRADPIDLLDLRGGGDPERLDLVGQVAAVHGRVREVAVDRAAEHVAAALRNRVQRRAARARLRAQASGLELHLLDGAAVGDVARAIGRADEKLVAETVERRARAGLAVEEGVGALGGPGVSGAADIGLGRGKPRRHVRQRLQANGAARQRHRGRSR